MLLAGALQLTFSSRAWRNGKCTGQLMLNNIFRGQDRRSTLCMTSHLLTTRCLSRLSGICTRCRHPRQNPLRMRTTPISLGSLYNTFDGIWVCQPPGQQVSEARERQQQGSADWRNQKGAAPRRQRGGRQKGERQRGAGLKKQRQHPAQEYKRIADGY